MLCIMYYNNSEAKESNTPIATKVCIITAVCNLIRNKKREFYIYRLFFSKVIQNITVILRQNFNLTQSQSIFKG